MTFSQLLRRNLSHYWQTNLAVVAGVGVATAVLAGALLVGASVRSSLRSLALERLGAVDQVITTTGFVREAFADDLIEVAAMRDTFSAAVPLVAIEGFVTHQESGRRASAVQVYGVDDRFWAFHGRNPIAPGRREVLLSQGLADELGAELDQSLIVRVEKPSVVPISSLHGRRDDAARSLRLTISGVLGPDALGTFSFRPQQGVARSVFVSLSELQQALEQPQRVNTILLGFRDRSAGGGDGPRRLATAEAAVRDTARLDDVGLRIRALPAQSAIAVESTSGLIGDDTARAVSVAAGRVGLREQPVLTYLANELRVGDRVTPYSLITAVDLDTFGPTRDIVATTDGTMPPVVLNGWAADDLDTETGEVLEVTYYVWEDEGRLVTRRAEFRVAGVTPLEGSAIDPELAPDYPGITEADNLVEWDPPFEVDLSLIRPEDEDYWDRYRTTPKAFVSLDEGQRLWDSRWGRLTSVRLLPADGDPSDDIDPFRAALASELDPLDVSFVVYPARALALDASAGATDFGLYFIYFSFFLVVSALLLAALFFRLGVEQRLREIGLLRATGYPPAAIRRLFLSEGFVLATLGGVLGLVGAVVYGELIMLGLRTWWVDAVGTTRLTLFLSPWALGAGAIGGLAAAVGSIAATLRSLAPASPRSLLTGGLAEVTGLPPDAGPGRRARALLLAAVLAAIGLGLVALAAAELLGATAGFFAGGLVLLCAFLAFAWWWLNGRPRRHTVGPWSVTQVGFRNATYRPGRSVLCIALIAFAAFIIVAVDAFRREGAGGTLHPRSGTGGFTLLADSLVPIAHDLDTAAGREALLLDDLYQPTGPLDGVGLRRFRVRPGEDASCLNLYQAKDPRILAPTPAFAAEGRFAFTGSLAETPEEAANPWLLLDRVFPDGAVPAIADATSLTYALHLSIGDDFVLNPDSDRPTRLRIVAALADSIFQRELLIAEDQFTRLFPDYDGYRFFLIDAPPERTPAVAAALEDRLADFGLDVVSADERLAAFHRVENTYLATFQTLGGLGLILGTLGLGAVLLRNVLERRRELALLRAVGYNAGHLSLMVLAENAFLLFAGLLAGTVCAVIAIAPAWITRGGGLPVISLGLLLAVVVATGLTASLAATIAAFRSPLLHALRTE